MMAKPGRLLYSPRCGVSTPTLCGCQMISSSHRPTALRSGSGSAPTTAIQPYNVLVAKCRRVAYSAGRAVTETFFVIFNTMPTSPPARRARPAFTEQAGGHRLARASPAETSSFMRMFASKAHLPPAGRSSRSFARDSPIPRASGRSPSPSIETSCSISLVRVLLYPE